MKTRRGRRDAASTAQAVPATAEVWEAGYCVTEVRIGEEATEIAKKLRELAAQVEDKK